MNDRPFDKLRANRPFVLLQPKDPAGIRRIPADTRCGNIPVRLSLYHKRCQVANVGGALSVVHRQLAQRVKKEIDRNEGA